MQLYAWDCWVRICTRLCRRVGTGQTVLVIDVLAVYFVVRIRKTPAYDKMKAGCVDWSHTAQDLKHVIEGNDRRDGMTRKKM